MRKRSTTQNQQAQLVFTNNMLWNQIPDARKRRCRELLEQMLRTLVLNPAKGKTPDE